MSEVNYIELIYDQLDGRLSAEDSAVLKKWLDANESNREVYEETKSLWELEETFRDTSIYDNEQALQKVKLANQNSNHAHRRFSIGSILTLAASFIAIAAVILFLNRDEKKVFIADNTIKKIELVDGSFVTLRPNSELSIKTIGAKNHVYHLDGQANFNVAKNSERNFIVQSDDFSVEVIGTRFDVNTDPIGNVNHVRVMDGLVSVANAVDTVRTKRGEATTVTASTLQTKPYQSTNADSWSTNRLTFKKAKLASVLKDLTSHFNQSYTLDNINLSECEVTATFINESIEGINAHLESSLAISIRITEGVYVISGSTCR